MLPLPRGAVWQIFFLLCAVLLANEVRSEGRVVCYYTNWSVYRPGTAKFNPQNINPYLCTHLIYAFGGFTKDNTMKPFDKYQDIEQGGYAKFTGLKTYNKQLKTLIAIGGWNEASSRFSPLVASPERRQQFIKNILKFLRQNHFDGIDLDWEYPAHRDGGKPRDKDNYAQFVQELRAEFDRESTKTGRPRLLLTMAVPAGIQYIEKGYDIPKLNKYLDWFNLLTYDFHSSHEPSANHHAPLYSLEDEDEYNFDSDLNIDYSVKFYLDAGADRDKLVLGIPTYGRSYTLFNEDSTDLGAPADGPGEQGDATREKGYLAYYEICQNIKEDPDWNVVQPNPKAMGPYAYKGNQWVGYDDEAIVRKKAEYVAEHNLGGIMFWAIDNDDFRGICTGKPYPLIEAAKETYLDHLGLGDNEVAKPSSKKKPLRSRSRNGSSNRNKVEEVVEKAVSNSRKRPATRKRPQSDRQTTTTTTTTSSSLYIGGRTTTPQPPTTPDPGSDFKCEDEGFFQHPRDCKKYFWCLDSGPSNLGIVAHQFTCPSGLYFNPAADSCDFARNVPCNKNPKEAPSTTAKPTTTTTTPRTTTTSSRITAATSRNTFSRFTSTTQEPEDDEDEYEDEVDDVGVDAEEDPKVIKELIDLIKKVGGIEELEKHILLQKDGTVMLKKDESSSNGGTTTPASISKSLFDKVLSRPNNLSAFRNKFTSSTLFRSTSKPKTVQIEEEEDAEDSNSGSKYSSVVRNSRPGPQNAGIDKLPEFDGLLKEKKKYVTIQRTKPSTTEVDEDADEKANIQNDEDEEDDDEDVVVSTSRRPSTSPTPSYVSIRRTKPTIVSPTDDAEDEKEVDATTEKKSYVPLSRNRGRSTTEAVEVETTTVAAGNRYKFLERTRPTRRPTVTEAPKDGIDEESAESEDPVSVTVQYTETNEVSTQSPTQQPQTTTRAYASIGRRTTISTPSTTTTLPASITTTLPESFVIDTTTPEPIIITTTATSTTTITNPTSIEISTNSSTTTTPIPTSPASTLIPSLSQDGENATIAPKIPNSLATESGLDTQELDSTQNQILTETTTIDDINRNEVTNQSDTSTITSDKSQSSLDNNISSNSRNSTSGTLNNRLTGGSRRQQQNQRRTTTTTIATTTIDTNQRQETSPITNDFLGTVSSPRPFGFPRRRTRPTTTKPTVSNGSDDTDTLSTLPTSDSATPTLVKKVSSTQESYLRSRLSQNLDRTQNGNGDSSLVVDHKLVVDSLVKGTDNSDDDVSTKSQSYSWKDARNPNLQSTNLAQGERRDDERYSQTGGWQSNRDQSLSSALNVRDGEGASLGLNGFDRFANKFNSGKYSPGTETGKWVQDSNLKISMGDNIDVNRGDGKYSVQESGKQQSNEETFRVWNGHSRAQVVKGEEDEQEINDYKSSTIDESVGSRRNLGYSIGTQNSITGSEGESLRSRILSRLQGSSSEEKQSSGGKIVESSFNTATRTRTEDKFQSQSLQTNKQENDEDELEKEISALDSDVEGFTRERSRNRHALAAEVQTKTDVDDISKGSKRRLQTSSQNESNESIRNRNELKLATQSQSRANNSEDIRLRSHSDYSRAQGRTKLLNSTSTNLSVTQSSEAQVENARRNLSNSRRVSNFAFGQNQQGVTFNKNSATSSRGNIVYGTVQSTEVSEVQSGNTITSDRGNVLFNTTNEEETSSGPITTSIDANRGDVLYNSSQTVEATNETKNSITSDRGNLLYNISDSTNRGQYNTSHHKSSTSLLETATLEGKTVSGLERLRGIGNGVQNSTTNESKTQTVLSGNSSKVQAAIRQTVSEVKTDLNSTASPNVTVESDQILNSTKLESGDDSNKRFSDRSLNKTISSESDVILVSQDRNGTSASNNRTEIRLGTANGGPVRKVIQVIRSRRPVVVKEQNHTVSEDRTSIRSGSSNRFAFNETQTIGSRNAVNSFKFGSRDATLRRIKNKTASSVEGETNTELNLEADNGTESNDDTTATTSRVPATFTSRNRLSGSARKTYVRPSSQEVTRSNPRAFSFTTRNQIRAQTNSEDVTKKTGEEEDHSVYYEASTTTTTHRPSVVNRGSFRPKFNDLSSLLAIDFHKHKKPLTETEAPREVVRRRRPTVERTTTEAVEDEETTTRQPRPTRPPRTTTTTEKPEPTIRPTSSRRRVESSFTRRPLRPDSSDSQTQQGNYALRRKIIRHRIQSDMMTSSGVSSSVNISDVGTEAESLRKDQLAVKNAILHLLGEDPMVNLTDGSMLSESEVKVDFEQDSGTKTSAGNRYYNVPTSQGEFSQSSNKKVNATGISSSNDATRKQIFKNRYSSTSFGTLNRGTAVPEEVTTEKVDSVNQTIPRGDSRLNHPDLSSLLSHDVHTRRRFNVTKQGPVRSATNKTVTETSANEESTTSLTETTTRRSFGGINTSGRNFGIRKTVVRPSGEGISSKSESGSNLSSSTLGTIVTEMVEGQLKEAVGNQIGGTSSSSLGTILKETVEDQVKKAVENQIEGIIQAQASETNKTEGAEGTTAQATRGFSLRKTITSDVSESASNSSASILSATTVETQSTEINRVEGEGAQVTRVVGTRKTIISPSISTSEDISAKTKVISESESASNSSSSASGTKEIQTQVTEINKTDGTDGTTAQVSRGSGFRKTFNGPSSLSTSENVSESESGSKSLSSTLGIIVPETVEDRVKEAVENQVEKAVQNQTRATNKAEVAEDTKAQVTDASKNREGLEKQLTTTLTRSQIEASKTEETLSGSSAPATEETIITLESGHPRPPFSGRAIHSSSSVQSNELSSDESDKRYDNPLVPIYHRRRYYKYLKDSPIIYIGKFGGNNELTGEATIPTTPLDKQEINKTIFEVFDVFNHSRLEAAARNEGKSGNGVEVKPQDNPPNSVEDGSSIAQEINTQLDHFLVSAPRTTESLGASEASSTEKIPETTEGDNTILKLAMDVNSMGVVGMDLALDGSAESSLEVTESTVKEDLERKTVKGDLSSRRFKNIKAIEINEIVKEEGESDSSPVTTRRTPFALNSASASTTRRSFSKSPLTAAELNEDLAVTRVSSSSPKEPNANAYRGRTRLTQGSLETSTLKETSDESSRAEGNKQSIEARRSLLRNQSVNRQKTGVKEEEINKFNETTKPSLEGTTMYTLLTEEASGGLISSINLQNKDSNKSQTQSRGRSKFVALNEVSSKTRTVSLDQVADETAESEESDRTSSRQNSINGSRKDENSTHLSEKSTKADQKIISSGQIEEVTSIPEEELTVIPSLDDFDSLTTILPTAESKNDEETSKNVPTEVELESDSIQSTTESHRSAKTFKDFTTENSLSSATDEENSKPAVKEAEDVQELVETSESISEDFSSSAQTSLEEFLEAIIEDEEENLSTTPFLSSESESSTQSSDPGEQGTRAQGLSRRRPATTTTNNPQETTNESVTNTSPTSRTYSGQSRRRPTSLSPPTENEDSEASTEPSGTAINRRLPGINRENHGFSFTSVQADSNSRRPFTPRSRIKTLSTTEAEQDDSTSNPTQRNFSSRNSLRTFISGTRDQAEKVEEDLYNEIDPTTRPFNRLEKDEIQSEDSTTERSFSGGNRVRTFGLRKSQELVNKTETGGEKEDNEVEPTRPTFGKLNRFRTTTETLQDTSESTEKPVENETEASTQRTFTRPNYLRTTTERSTASDIEAVIKIEDSDESTSKRTFSGLSQRRVTTTTQTVTLEESTESNNQDTSSITRGSFSSLARLSTTTPEPLGTSELPEVEASTELESEVSSTPRSDNSSRKSYAGLNRIRTTTEALDFSQTTEIPQEEDSNEIENSSFNPTAAPATTRRTFVNINRLRTTTSAPTEESNSENSVESTTSRRTFSGVNRFRTTTEPSEILNEVSEKELEDDNESTTGRSASTRRTFGTFNRSGIRTTAPTEVEIEDRKSNSRRTYGGINRSTTTEEGKDTENEPTTRRTYGGINRSRASTTVSTESPQQLEDEIDSPSSSTRRTYTGFNRSRPTTLAPNEASETEQEVTDEVSENLNENKLLGTTTSRRTFGSFNRSRINIPTSTESSELENQQSTSTRRTYAGINRSRTTTEAGEALEVKEADTKLENEKESNLIGSTNITKISTESVGLEENQIKNEDTTKINQVTTVEPSEILGGETANKLEVSTVTEQSTESFELKEDSTEVPVEEENSSKGSGDSISSTDAIIKETRTKLENTNVSSTDSSKTQEESTSSDNVTSNIVKDLPEESETELINEEKSPTTTALTESSNIDEDLTKTNTTTANSRGTSTRRNRLRTTTTESPSDEDLLSTTRRTPFRSRTTAVPEIDEDVRSTDDEDEVSNKTGPRYQRPLIGINIIRTTTDTAPTRRTFTPINVLRAASSTTSPEEETVNENEDLSENEVSPRPSLSKGRFSSTRQESESDSQRQTVSRARYQFPSRQNTFNRNEASRTQLEASVDKDNAEEEFSSEDTNTKILRSRNQLKVHDVKDSEQDTEGGEEVIDEEEDQTPRNIVDLINANRSRTTETPPRTLISDDENHRLENDEKPKLTLLQLRNRVKSSQFDAIDDGVVSTRLQQINANRKPSNLTSIYTYLTNQTSTNLTIDSNVDRTQTNTLSLTDANANDEESKELGQDQHSEPEDSILETNPSLSTNSPNLNRRFQRVQFNRTAARRRPTTTTVPPTPIIRTRTRTRPTARAQVNVSLTDVDSTSTLNLTSTETGTTENVETDAGAPQPRRRFRVLKFKRPLIANNSLSLEINNSTNTTTSSTESVDNLSLGLESDSTNNITTPSPSTTPTRRFRKVIRKLRPVGNATVLNEGASLNDTERPFNIAELINELSANESTTPSTITTVSDEDEEESTTLIDGVNVNTTEETTSSSISNETLLSDLPEANVTSEISTTDTSTTTPNPRRLLISRRPYRPTKPSINAITSTESSSIATPRTYVRKFNRNFKAIRPPTDAANGIGFIQQSSTRPLTGFKGRNRFNFPTRTSATPQEEEEVEEEVVDEKEDGDEETHVEEVEQPKVISSQNEAQQDKGNKNEEKDEEEGADEEDDEDDELVAEIDEDTDDEDEDEEEDEEEGKDKVEEKQEEVKLAPPAPPQTSNRPSNRPSFNRPVNTPFAPNRTRTGPAGPAPVNRFALDRRPSNKPRVINRPTLITLSPNLIDTDNKPVVPTSITPPSVFISTNTRTYERKYSASSTETTPQDQSNPLLEDLNIDALNARNKKIFEVNSKKHTTTKPKLIQNQPQPTSDTTDTPNNSLDTSTIFDDDDNNLINSQDDAMVTTTEGVTEQPASAIEGQLISYSPKQKIITISRVVEINSKEDKLRRKSKNDELKTVESTELRSEGLPTLEALGEISRVKYVHLVDGSAVLVDGRSSVADYTPTESSTFVRNTIPEVEPDSLENTRIEYEYGSTSAPVRNTIPDGGFSNVLLETSRNSKAITVPEVIADVVEASTISLQGLFDSARQAKKIDSNSNEVNGIVYAYSLGEVPTTPRNEKPTISSTTFSTTPLTESPSTTMLTTTPTPPEPTSTTTSSTTSTTTTTTTEATTTTTPTPLPTTTIEEAAESAIESTTVSAPVLATTNRTYTRPIVPLLRPESNESPLVRTGITTITVRRPVVRRRLYTTTAQPAAGASNDELNAEGTSTTISTINTNDEASAAAVASTSSTTSLFKYNRRTRPSYLTTISAKLRPTPRVLSTSSALNPGEISSTTTTGSAAASSNDITFITVNKLSNQKFPSGVKRRKLIRPLNANKSAIVNSGSVLPSDEVAYTDPPRTHNPLFKRRFPPTTTAAPVTTTVPTILEFNTSPLFLETSIPEDLDQIAKSSIQETKFFHNQIGDNLNEPYHSPELPISTSVLSSTTPRYSSTYDEPITRRVGIAYSSTRRQSFRRPQKTTPIPKNMEIFISRRRPHKTPAPFNKIIETPNPGRTYKPVIDYDYYDDGDERVVDKPTASQVKVVLHGKGIIECLDQGNFPHPLSCRKFISCAKFETGGVVGWEYTCPKGLSYDPVGGICNWSAGLGCQD